MTASGVRSRAISTLPWRGRVGAKLRGGVTPSTREAQGRRDDLAAAVVHRRGCCCAAADPPPPGEGRSAYRLRLPPSPPEIHFDDPFVGADRIERAFGQDRALVQDGDLDVEVAHEGHVMLDNDDGAVLGDLAQQ